METRIWEHKKSALLPYRQRRPETTDLYRIVYAIRDDLPRVWEQRFQPDYGCLREEVKTTLDAFLNCGILAHGCARFVCECCNTSIVVAFSCKKRGVCPSCSAKRALIFAEHLEKEVLLNAPHRHLVCSIPKRLRPYFRYKRSLLGKLQTAAWESYKQFIQELAPEALPGAVLTHQTAGDSLNFNPHVHGIISAGGFDKADNFHKVLIHNSELLEKLFMHKVLSFLRAEKLIGESVTAEILSRQHSGFSVWLGETIEPHDSDYKLFLAQYIDRGPVANNRISIKNNLVLYETKDEELLSFDPLEFLARLSAHIPDKWESCSRYFGRYSHRVRGKRARQVGETAAVLAVIPQDIDKRKASKSWAALIKRVFEIDPLLCPKCSGNMKIKAFIIDTAEVNRLLKHLNVCPFLKPEPLSCTGPPPMDTDTSHILFAD